MKTPIAVIAGAATVLVSGVALAQSANMQEGGTGGIGWMGGFGGLWLPILLLVLVVGVVTWVVARPSK